MTDVHNAIARGGMLQFLQSRPEIFQKDVCLAPLLALVQEDPTFFSEVSSFLFSQVPLKIPHI